MRTPISTALTSGQPHSSRSLQRGQLGLIMGPTKLLDQPRSASGHHTLCTAVAPQRSLRRICPPQNDIDPSGVGGEERLVLEVGGEFLDIERSVKSSA